MPDHDPFPVSLHDEAGRQLRRRVIGGTIASVVVAGAVAAGVWLASNFRVVPAGEPTSFFRLADGTDEPVAEGGAGPFAFRFAAGERTTYSLNAMVGGQGIDMGDTSDVDLQMSSYMHLDTESVDRRGNASLQLSFDETTMQGSFMDSPFAMFSGASGATVQNAGQTVVDTTQGIGSTDNIPQLAFLRTPVKMKVTSSGEVTHLSGPKGIGALLGEMPLYSELDFPSDRMKEGSQWTSDFAMPIPGFAQPAKASIENRFIGYEDYAGRRCGVIEQTIRSSQEQGTLDSPESVFGEAMGFSMPNFKLSGESIVYFDVDNGKLVYNDMNLNVKLEIGQALGGAGAAISGMFEQMGSLINEDLPEFEGFGKKKEGQKNLLDLDLDVHATLALTEQVSPLEP